MYKAFLGNVDKMAQSLNKFEAEGNIIISKTPVPTNGSNYGLLVEYAPAVKGIEEPPVAEEALPEEDGVVEFEVEPKKRPGRPRKEAN